MARIEFNSIDRSPQALKDRMVVGRNAEMADVVVDDKRLSRKHCEFAKTADGYTVKDLGSRNGTKVNGDDAKGATKIEDGDEISLGGLIIHFRTDADADETSDVDDLELDDDGFDLDDADELDLDSDDAKPTDSSAGKKGPSSPGLKLLKGTIKAVIVPINDFPFNIGRKPDNDLPLDNDSQASGHHVKLELTTDGRVKIVDLNSTNGLKLEGKRVDEGILEEGSRFTVGSQTFRFLTKRDVDHASAGGKDDVDLDGDGVEVLDLGGGSSGNAEEEEELQLGVIGDMSDLDMSGGDDDKTEAERLEEAVVDASAGGGKMVFRVLEILVVLIVLGAIGALFNFIGKIEPSVEAGSSKSVRKATGDPGLTQAPYHSFEHEPQKTNSLTEFPRWRVTRSAENDSYQRAVVTDAVGGDHVLQISRAKSGYERTAFRSTTRIAVEPGKGLTLAGWFRAIKGTPSGFLSVDWFPDNTSELPARSDFRAFKRFIDGEEWAEISATVVPPSGASYAAIGVGLTGATGTLQIDEITATAVDDSSATLVSAGSFPALAVDDTAGVRITIPGEEGSQAILANARIVLSVGSNSDIDLPIEDWLISTPTVEKSEGGATWHFNVFDPDASEPVKVSLSASDRGWEMTLSGSSATRFVSTGIVGEMTAALAPDEMALLRGGLILQWGTDFDGEASSGNRVTRIVAANTAGTRAFDLLAGDVVVSGRRLRLLTSSRSLKVVPRFDDSSEEYDQLMDARRASISSDRASTNPERMEAGLRLILEYPTDRQGVLEGQKTIEAVAIDYQIKQRQLATIVDRRDDVGKNADHFIDAVDQAERLYAEIEQHRVDWRAKLADVYAMRNSPWPVELKSAVGRVNRISAELFESTFVNLQQAAEAGKQEAVRLRGIRQQIRSEPLMREAEAHMDNGAMVQARLKFERVIDDYPLSRNATEARADLLRIGDALADEYDALRADILNRIASETKDKLEALLAFVETSAASMTAEQIAIIADTDSSAGTWQAQEAQIRERIASLRTRIGS